MTKETKEYWNFMSKSYQEDSKLKIDINYGPGSPNEKSLRLLGNLKGKSILEIGCGGAQCSIAFAKKGAKVSAMDLSSEQLKFAKALAKKHNVKISFYQGDIKNLKQIKSNSQNIVFSAFALQYIDDLLKCFKEVKRVLKKDGKFVFSLDHPFYWTANPKTLKLENSYFNTGKFEMVHNLEGKKVKFVSYNHTFSELYNSLIKSGLVVEQVIEPDSRRRYKEDPWYGLWGVYLPQYMKIFPPTIIFKCKK